MGRTAAIGLAALISGCSGDHSRVVEGSPSDVRAAINSQSEQLYLADQVIGAAHWQEQQDNGIVWHFTLNGSEYGRYRIVLADFDGKTRLGARFEPVEDTSAPAVPFLRDSATAVSDEIVLAALEKRPVDVEAIERKYVANTIRNPSAVIGVERQYWDEARNITR